MTDQWRQCLNTVTGSVVVGGKVSSLRTVAIYVPTLVGGGAETSMLRLCEALQAQGYAIDLVVNRRTGSRADRVPRGVRVVELGRQSKLHARLTAWRAYPEDWRLLLRPVLLTRRPVMTLPYLAALADYLHERRPAVLISAMFYANLLALWARGLAGVDTRVIVSEHTTLSRRICAQAARAKERGRWRHLPPLLTRLYQRADAIVTVSDGVGADLSAVTGLPRNCLTTIYNPVVWPGMMGAADAPLNHPWFAQGAPPVILAAGRLETSKDYPTLIEAFARVRATRRLRLMILGEGRLRSAIEAKIEKLGLADDVALPGWVNNPYAYMRRARLFVLSSRWEGLGNVLIEAMACGCPVVSTDCPSGPREILADGRYGELVPVEKPAALADAIEKALEVPPDSRVLRRRAADFSLARSAACYRALIDDFLVGPEGSADASID